MRGKVILVIMDGVGYATAVAQCGFLEGMVEAGRARRWRMQAALPTRSAPLYETLHTGLVPAEHGITANEMIRQSNKPNVFGEVHRAGGRTAAVAHAWYFTLYNGRNYDMIERHRGRRRGARHPAWTLYSQEGYGPVNSCAPAEIDLCAQLALLLRRHQPALRPAPHLLSRTLGHTFTAHSTEYREQTWRIDNALARTLPLWLDLGYEIFVTADHGMNGDGHHGGTDPIERDVPFYYFGGGIGPGKYGGARPALPSRRPALARIGIAIPTSMHAPVLFN